MKNIILPSLLILSILAAGCSIDPQSGSGEYEAVTSALEESDVPHEADGAVDEADGAAGETDDSYTPESVDTPEAFETPAVTNRLEGAKRPWELFGPDWANKPRRIRIVLERNTYRLGETVDFKIRDVPDDAVYTVSVINTEDLYAKPKIIINNELIADTAGHHTITVVSGDVSATAGFTVADLEALRYEFFLLTNAEREKNGLHPLEHDERLDSVALIRVLEIVEFFSHTRPDGRFFDTAFKEEGLPNREWSENLASGQRTPQEAIKDLMESDSHGEAILDSGFEYLGTGAYMDDNGVFYWVQTFM